MDVGLSEAIALVAGLVVGNVRFLWGMRRWRGHEHVYETMRMDGKWHCAICDRPKKRGT